MLLGDRSLRKVSVVSVGGGWRKGPRIRARVYVYTSTSEALSHLPMPGRAYLHDLVDICIKFRHGSHHLCLLVLFPPSAHGNGRSTAGFRRRIGVSLINPYRARAFPWAGSCREKPPSSFLAWPARLFFFSFFVFFGSSGLPLLCPTSSRLQRGRDGENRITESGQGEKTTRRTSQS